MKINIYAISKQSPDEYDKLAKNLDKMSLKYAQVKYIPIFNNKIAKAQNGDETQSKVEYDKAFSLFLDKGYNIALNPSSKVIDTLEFSEFFRDKMEVNFFIGGAFGFGREFIQKCDRDISLSNLTMSHKIARLVLHEQIYRALSILANHPYHK